MVIVKDIGQRGAYRCVFIADFQGHPVKNNCERLFEGGVFLAL